MLTREHLIVDRAALTATVLDRDECQTHGIPVGLSPRDLFMLLLTADRTHAVPGFTYGDFRRLCGPLELPGPSGQRGDPGLARKAMQFLKVASGPTAVRSVFEARLACCRNGCPHLKTVAGRFYCGTCGCGHWPLAELRTKLWWARVECPAGRFPAIDEQSQRKYLQPRWRSLIGRAWRRASEACRHPRARLRPSNLDASAGSVKELERIVSALRAAWPEVRIVIRGDSGFCRDHIMRWCEQHGVDYVLGLAKNERLKAEIADQLAAAKRAFEDTDQPARVFKDFSYQTLKSWSRSRRVVGKAEHLAKGANPRFVVTSLSADDYSARILYEVEYCGRGDMENRIKEQQLGLFADRTSAATMRANQLRLWLSSVAYTLMLALRRLGLQGTELAKAQCGTIRLKLLKIGAHLRVTVRKVWVSFTESCPYQSLFRKVCDYLCRQPPFPLRC